MPLDKRFLKLINIGLKVAEFVLALIYLSVVSHSITQTALGEVLVCSHIKVTSFITVTAGLTITTFLLAVVHLHDQSAEKQKKSIFEIMFNTIAVIFLVSASVTLLSLSEKLISGFPGRNAWRAGGIMGLMNAVLYGLSAVLAFIDYNRSE